MSSDGLAALSAALPDAASVVIVERVHGAPITGTFVGLNTGTLVTFVLVRDADDVTWRIPWANVSAMRDWSHRNYPAPWVGA